MGPATAEGPELGQLLEPLLRHWRVVVLVALAISAATYFYYREQGQTYTASTSVFLQPSPVDAMLRGGDGGATDPKRLVHNQARLTKTPAVAERAARKLDFRGDPRALLSLVSVSPDAEADFLEIAATAPDPGRAADLANAFAGSFVEIGTGQLREDAAKARAAIERHLSQLEPTAENRSLRRSLQARLQRASLVEAVPVEGARQVDRAVASSAGSESSPARKAVFAGVLGLLLGALLVHALDALHRRLPASRTEAEYGMQLLASIPFDRKAAREAQRELSLPLAMVEPVRSVRTTLDHAAMGGGPRTILIASAISGEGKSTLTKSLALAFLQSGRDVLVIDADMREPTLHELLLGRQEPGLSDVLLSTISFNGAVQEIRLDRREVERVSEAGLGASESPADPESEQDLGLESEIQRMLDDGLLSIELPFNQDEGAGRGDAHLDAVVPLRADQAGAGSANGSSSTGPALGLLSSGSPIVDPAALLGRGEMVEVLLTAAEAYDVVLIDSSPLLEVSDAVPLAAAVDGVVVVTRPGVTTRDAAEGLRRMLGRLPETRVLGLVANGVRRSAFTRQNHYAGSP